MEGKGLTVVLLLLFMISAATACKGKGGFCFGNCSTTNPQQFCNCVVNEVVARNDSESLENDTIVNEFEDHAEMILENATGCIWCCTFIIIRQNLPQGRVYILQFHCTKVDFTFQSITKYWSYTAFLVPFLPPPGCSALDFDHPCNCTTTNPQSAAITQCDSEAENSSASGTAAMFFINAVLTGTSFMMLLVL